MKGVIPHGTYFSYICHVVADSTFKVIMKW